MSQKTKTAKKQNSSPVNVGENSKDNKSPKQNFLKKRSKRYRENYYLLKSAIEENGSEIFTLEKAIQLLLQMKQPKFENGSSVEFHCNLNIDPTKGDQLVRGSLILPHGTGKKLRIAAFVLPENVAKAKELGAYLAGGEDLIEQIKKEGKVDFDLAIAQPELMKKLPVIARILGTSGVMPNPKTGTVGDDIEQMLKEFTAGKLNFKNDKTGNLHIPFGRINSEFTAEKLLENLKAILENVEKLKPEVVKKKFIKTAYVVASMCPAVRIV